MADDVTTKNQNQTKTEATEVANGAASDSGSKSAAPTADPVGTDSPASPSIPVPPPPSTDTPAKETLITESAADSAPGTTAPAAPDKPIVVEDKDVEGASGSEPSNEKLAEEIEVLTGEIQALEAKIERLTSGATESSSDGLPAAPAADVAPISQTDANTTQPPAPPTVSPPAPVKDAPATAASEDEFVSKPKETPSQSVPVNTLPKDQSVNDISMKPATAPSPEPTEPAEEPASSGGSSGLAIIGEVIAVFGVVIFVLLAISPFFRETVGEDTYQAVQQIGWLSALGTLGLGLLLVLFTKGRGLFKFLLFFLLVIAAVLFLALSGSSLVSPIAEFLDPLLTFYR